MTAVDLAAIKARAEAAAPVLAGAMVFARTSYVAASAADVPALLSLVEERDSLAAENARLRQQLAAAEASPGDAQAMDDLVAERDKLRTAWDELVAERDEWRKFGQHYRNMVAAMTPVVEAARAWADVLCGSTVAEYESPLVTAVAAFDARQQGQEGAQTGLSATETAHPVFVGEQGPELWTKDELDEVRCRLGQPTYPVDQINAEVAPFDAREDEDRLEASEYDE